MKNSPVDLVPVAKSIRRSVIQMAHASGASHTGSALSIADLLTVLYFKVLNVNPEQPKLPERDRFILSKGHASAALYAVLAERGFIDKALLKTYYQDGGALPGHVDFTAVQGIEASAGSLGHGLSLGAGMALALRTDHPGSRVFVLMGDGELNEGSVWEALMFIPHQRLRNVTVIVDCNNYQGYGASDVVLNMSPLDQKLAAFGWQVVKINGHDLTEIESALQADAGEKPKVVLARTVKGKGVSFMEGEFVWHYKSPNDDQLTQALKELE
ncbi:MAG: transketolase [Pontiellaceae bacterium]|nr:transketolase [Pontiellaceae bacterium]